jgi:hypothetical protein
MNKFRIVFFFVLATFSVSAQEVISSQGESYTNSNGSIDFTIGEVIINTETNGTNGITQGFHQTNWVFVGLDDYVSAFDVSVFPNPSEDVLHINTSSFENVSYTLFDAAGKMILQDKLSEEQTQIHVSHLSPGNYTLTIQSTTQNLKSFKLTKLSK